MYAKIISFLLKNKPFVHLLVLLILIGAYVYSPIGLEGNLPLRNPIGVDAIPNLGENQQIVSVEWPGHNPKEIEDQITFPLSASLLGVSGVNSVRTSSMYGLSSIYVIFDENQDFYESRTRLLEKLASLEPGIIPDDLRPKLGPDATGLGQVYWYTLHSDTKTQEELRSTQDFYIRPMLASVAGVAEVSSIGGYEKEYHVLIDAEKLKRYGFTYRDISSKIQANNQEISAKTMEINRVEYLVRSNGYLGSLKDFSSIAIGMRSGQPVYLKDVAKITLAPKPRRGLLDVNGEPAVGGVVVSRYGENPAEVIAGIKNKLQDIEQAFPDIELKPFYDRSNLIEETLATLWEALSLELVITVLIVLLALQSFRSSMLISAVLPIAVFLVFISMYILDLEANIVALAGIAIAIGTMVDMGIVMIENIKRHIQDHPEHSLDRNIIAASKEVSPAILTALLTTLISFTPVFLLDGVEGKLFNPLAWTKTLALVSAYLISVLLLPVYASVLLQFKWPFPRRKFHALWFIPLIVLLIFMWSPLGMGASKWINGLMVLGLILPILGIIYLIYRYYEPLLNRVLEQKFLFLLFPIFMLGAAVWIFPQLPKAFMPTLDEGSFLLMPTTLPNSSINENKKYLAALDRAVAEIPEVERVVGKAGRVNSALDPAPLSMFENIIIYKPEYGENGVRNWRDHIESADDIWNEISQRTKFPGLTSAPKLQPIQTRLLMLQTGMRAPMGIKIKGNSLEDLNQLSSAMERLLMEVEGINPSTVFSEKLLGKPYLNIEPKRNRIAQYGISVADIQEAVETAISGKLISTLYQGRERYGIRLRYPVDYRDNLNALMDEILVADANRNFIPLRNLADLVYEPGPQVIKGEDGFLVNYLVFDKYPDFDANQVIENAQIALQELDLSVYKGVSYSFSGDYKNQKHAEESLMVLMPLVLVIILIVLQIQFKSFTTTMMIFVGVFTALSGGFLALYVAGNIALTVAVWIGFIALFGIATDDGVLMATYLDQVFKDKSVESIEEIRSLVKKAGLKRIRPCLMTTATTLIALLPVLTVQGKGSELLVPMAVPGFGGMLISLISLFIVPVLYSWRAELKFKKQNK